MSSQSSVNSSSFNSVKSISMRALDKTDKVLTKSLRFLSNSYVYTLILVILILYAPVAAPMLSSSIVNLLGNYAVKLVYVFLLAYLLSKSVKVALLTSVVIVVGIFLLKQFNVNENLDGSVSGETKTQKIESDPSLSQDSDSSVNSQDSQKSQPEMREVEPRLLMDKVDGPVPADTLTNVHADAEHENTLQPPSLNKINFEKEVNQTDIIDVCGSRQSSDGYTGFDESSDKYSQL